MILRRKPTSADDFLAGSDDPRGICREEEAKRFSAISIQTRNQGRPPFLTDSVRFDFEEYGAYTEYGVRKGRDSLPRTPDFAVDVDWNDVVEIIGGLARVARHARNKINGRPDEGRMPLSASEEAIITAITALAKQIGIVTEPQDETS